MLLNRSIKQLPASKRHDAIKIRLADMIAWLGDRPRTEAVTTAIAHLLEAKKKLGAAWPEFEDLKHPRPPAPPIPVTPPVVVRPSKPPTPRQNGKFVSTKEPTT